MLKNWTQFNRNVGSSCVDCFSHLLISWSEQMLWLHSRRLWPAGSCSVGEWSGEMSKILSQSKSKSKSKVQSRKDLEWLYSAVPPPTISPPAPTHTNFSQQPDIQLSSNFHSRLTWPRLNDFRTNQEPCPPQIQLLTLRTGQFLTRFLMSNLAQIFTVDLNNQDKLI